MSRKTILLSTAFILGIGIEMASAVPGVPVLLTVDDSNPSAVVFTATGANSGVDDSGKTGNDGFDLTGFFSASEATFFVQSLSGSTLSGGGLGFPYNDVRGDNYSTTGGSAFDLQMFIDPAANGHSSAETFSTAAPAFTGSWTINFSTLGLNSSALPTAGSQGLIISGNNANPGSVIGQWEIAPVPEPATGSLLVLGSALGLFFWGRRTASI